MIGDVAPYLVLVWYVVSMVDVISQVEILGLLCDLMIFNI